MQAWHSGATTGGHLGQVFQHHGDPHMNRLIPALSALALCGGMFSAVAAAPTAPPEPKVIGADKPVFLGSMVVTATAL